MKQIFILIVIVFCFIRCSPHRITNVEAENQLLLTKRFVGRCDTSFLIERNYTKVYTTKEIIHVRLEGDTIPKQALCYIQLKPIQLAGQLNKTYRVFFTWYGTDKLYAIDEEKLSDN